MKTTLAEKEHSIPIQKMAPGAQIGHIHNIDEDGRIVMIAGHNNDLANFWDWYDEPGTPMRPAADAFRLGVNYVVYAISH